MSSVISSSVESWVSFLEVIGMGKGPVWKLSMGALVMAL